MAYIDSNIPKLIFYLAFVGEFLRIARSFFLYCVQGAQSLRCRKSLSKIIRKHEKAFDNFGKNCDEILSKLHT